MSTSEKIYKLSASLHANLWGGNKLRKYGKVSDADRIGESWELSFVKGAEALSDGITLPELFPKEAWGKNAQGFEFFPVLTKFIDANEKLSVQVHPDDAYALANEGMYGKSEMWYVVDAEPGAGLYMGFERKVEPDELRRSIENGTVEELLSFKPVSAGDVFFIPAGTVHAIGGGVLIYEIQQNSTLTYRLYDYMRRDKDGNLRELHVEKALKVLHAEPYSYNVSQTSDGCGQIIGKCDYFTAREYKSSSLPASITVTDSSFLALTVVKGDGVLSFTDELGRKAEQKLSLGDSYFIPKQDSPFTVTAAGDMTLITVEV